VSTAQGEAHPMPIKMSAIQMEAHYLGLNHFLVVLCMDMHSVVLDAWCKLSDQNEIGDFEEI
jgi:hypothetical protein